MNSNVNERISPTCHEAGPFEEQSWHEICYVSNGMNWNLIKAGAIIELGSFCVYKLLEGLLLGCQSHSNPTVILRPMLEIGVNQDQYLWFSAVSPAWATCWENFE